MSKVYVLCRIDRFGEEVLRASDEEGKDKLMSYAEVYHFDASSPDPDSSGLYRGLVIYECENNKEPYEYWGTSE